MNKKIKLTIVCLITIGAFSVIYQGGISIINTKAYADVSTYSLADRGELESLDVKSTDGKSLELCDDYDGYKKTLTDEKTYYVTLDGKSDGLKISAKSAGDDYVVKVFESDRKYATAHDLDENISIAEGKSTLYIRTFTSNEALKKAVKNEDVTNCANTYKLNINKSRTNGQDDIYIERLTLDAGKVPINFDRDTFSYDLSVNEDADEIAIKAEPEDKDNTVKIDGFKVDESNKYKKDLHLQKGKNEIKINITDDDEKIRTYILNITRGKTFAENIDTAKINQWAYENNKWIYNDSTGNSLKNRWYNDASYGKTYYFQGDGIMATEWLYYDGNWYYLGEDGSKKTGWQNVDNKWYYLDSNGVMAKNTKIDNFKLGNDGAWIK